MLLAHGGRFREPNGDARTLLVDLGAAIDALPELERIALVASVALPVLPGDSPAQVVSRYLRREHGGKLCRAQVGVLLHRARRNLERELVTRGLRAAS